MGIVRDFANGVGDLSQDALKGVGDGYQDVLLQDSPLGRPSGLETTDPWPETQAAEQPWPGLTGETLAPEADVSRDPGDFMALEAGAVIDADFDEIPDAPLIEHQPDIDGPDIDP